MGSKDFIDIPSGDSDEENANGELHHSSPKPNEAEDSNANSRFHDSNSEPNEASQSSTSQAKDRNPNNELHDSNCEQNEASQPSTSQVDDSICNVENIGQYEASDGHKDVQFEEDMDLDNDLVHTQPISQESAELASSVTVVEINTVQPEHGSENGCLVTVDDSAVSDHKLDETYKSGVKRPRMTYIDQQPSVHITYKALTRSSKRKLEELLQQWSEWHTHHDGSSNDTSKEALEYGEKTYFPAIHIGSDALSAVSFWMDNQSRPDQSKEFTTLESDTVPLYDRGFALGLTSADGSTNLDRGIDKHEASRCFNCGSYSHSLKECPKPRDNVAINNARKQHSSKRNPAGGPRLPTRYYQNSPGGKFDGLKPGIIGAETRQCLGIGELDPPPWLNRMRELGYPPGYLDFEAEDEPSGITIFTDEEVKEECEDGEILETGETELQKKTVEFPGINAPIPENADQRRWAPSPGPPSLDSFKNRQHPRPNRSSETGRGYGRDQRRSRDYRDEVPPGTEHQEDSPSMPSYAYRYGSYDSQSSRSNHPSYTRSLSDRGWSRPLAYEGSSSHSPHSPLPYLSSSLTGHAPHNYSPARFEYWAHESQHNSSSDLSSQRRDRYEHHRHHRK